MHDFIEESEKTAKGRLYLFSSAVLFLSTLAFSGLFTFPRAQAAGLEIRLEEKDRDLVSFGHSPKDVGLSISSDSIPLLKTNLSLTQTVTVDYEHQMVSISEKLGEYSLRKPSFLTLSSYSLFNDQLQTDRAWKQNLNSHFFQGAGSSKGIFEWEIPVKFPRVVSSIIGEGGPGLKVSGYRRISFSGRSQWQEGLVNTATSRQSKFPSLNMEQQSSFTITGTIGSKISVSVDQDSRRTTDLQNTLQLRYKGGEDEVIQTIEAGNTNLQVGSGVVGYAESKQGLFGIKTTAKIAGWNLTMITSQDKGSNQRAEFKAGAETQSFIIRDYQYLERTFYDLGYENDFAAGDSIVDIKLFKSNTNISSSTAQNPAPFGIAYVNPKDTLVSYSEESVTRRFQEINTDDYFVQRNQHWIQFFTALDKNDILATYYVVRHPNGILDTVGLVKDSCSSIEGEICMRLKLIKPDTPKPTDYTWDYEWKYVYFLNARNIERDGFRLDIYKGPVGSEDINQDKNCQDSTRYLRLFGLDQLDMTAQPNPDGIVDYRQVDFGLGYLTFRTRHPFAPGANQTVGWNDILGSFTGNPGDTLKDRVESIYSSNLQQDRMDNSKYYIYVQCSSRKSDFQLGHAPIIEGSDVVTLDGRPLKRGEDYTIVYETGEISFINTQALSPTANLSVDYEYSPLLSPEKKSMFGMMAEYNLGNNFKFGTVGIYKSIKTSEDRPRVGEESVRNFVWGSNLTFSSGAPFITRAFNYLPWVKTEAPSTINFHGELAQSIPNPNTQNKAYIDDFEGSLEYTDLSVRRGVWTLSSPPSGKDLSQRCRMWWYNPYDQVAIQDIWPDKEVETNAERTNVLELRFFPNQPQQPSGQNFDSNAVDRSWNGIMRSLYPGAYDQTRTKFLEVWVNGDKGVLHVDLGEISEDLNGNKILDTEDKPRNGQRDGILDDDEDLGLDTLDDDQERQVYNSSLPDPAGDNWNYDNKYDYSHINGTQGNRDDPDRGRHPDTEDINSNSVLDLSNDHFEFSLDLSKNDFLADLTHSVGWRLYRIPLKDPKNYAKVGNPDWSDIRFARLWLTSDQECTIDIASIQLVGNRWENLGISSLTNRQIPVPIGVSPDETFEDFVVNTQENPGYEPPPRVAGTLNRQTGVREKEQSLVLKFNQLKPYHQGSVYRILSYQPEDYTTYRNLKMFVHGPKDPGELIFFLRLGSDSSNFYEYHTKVYYGWDDRNEVNIDIDEITALKAYAIKSLPANSTAPIDTTSGPYRVRGSPALNRVRWFSMGVINIDTTAFQPTTGEVWVDEMQVTGIRKQKGVSGSTRIDATLADLANLSLSFNQRDSQYRNLDAKTGSGTSHSDYSLGLSSVQLHKLLPVSLGYSLPCTFNYSRTLEIPRWETGTDIILPKDLRDKEKRETVTENFGLTPVFSSLSNNWLLGLTLKRLSHSFSYSTSRSTSPSTPVQINSGYTVSGGYTFPFGKKVSLTPLGWLKGSLIPKSFTQMGFSLLPDNVSVNGTISQAQSHTQDNVGNVNDVYTRGFSGGLTAGASFIKGIPLGYTMSTTRDIRDPNTIKYSFNPKQAKLGIETGYSETFRASYSPAWLAFLNANFTFNSGYNENSDQLDNRNVGNTRHVSNSSDQSANGTLDWQKLLGGAKKDGKKTSIFNPFGLLRILSRRIDPVNVTFRRNKLFSKSGLLGRPSLSYRLGFIDDPQVGREGVAQSADQVTITDSYTAKSGFRLLTVDVGTNYSKSIGLNTTATDGTKTVSTRFPDLIFNLNRLGNLKLLKRYFTNVTYGFGYFKQIDQTGSEWTGETYSRKTGEHFTPLAAFSMDWKTGIRTTVRWTRDVTTDQDLRNLGGTQSVTKNYSNSIQINNNYSFSAPQGIKLPFLRKIKFRSNLTLSLNVSETFNKTKSSVGGMPFNVTANNDQLSIAIQSGYSFSSQVTGGFNARWADANDQKTKTKSHVRELGIYMQISF
ncbi:MAG: cell surface protein SprA [Candidatus Zixiibacteriota bacterium]